MGGVGSRNTEALETCLRTVLDCTEIVVSGLIAGIVAGKICFITFLTWDVTCVGAKRGDR